MASAVLHRHKALDPTVDRGEKRKNIRGKKTSKYIGKGSRGVGERDRSEVGNNRPCQHQDLSVNNNGNNNDNNDNIYGTFTTG